MIAAIIIWVIIEKTTLGYKLKAVGFNGNEYAFYEEKDISDYLNLLTTIRSYFQSILRFEEKKSQAGFFMSDTTLDRILAQCAAFIENPDDNYMQDIFQQKLSACKKISALLFLKKRMNILPMPVWIFIGISDTREWENSTDAATNLTAGIICYGWRR